MMGTSEEDERKQGAGPTGRRVAAGLAGLAGALVLAIVVLHASNGSHEVTAWWAANSFNVVAFVVPGTLLARQRTGNPLGWLLLGAGLSQAITGFAREYLVWAALHPGAGPGAGVVGAVGDPCYQLSFTVLPIILVLFPTGRLRSPRWRPVIVGAAAVGAIFYLGGLLYPGRWPTPGRSTANPLGVPGIETVLTIASMLAVLIGVAVLVAGVAGVVLRFRDATGAERDQLEWLGFAGLLATIEAASELLRLNPVESIAGPFAIGLMGVAIAVAVLRHRLLDIDLVLNRTLVYTALTVLVTGGYVAVVEALAAIVGRDVELGVSLVATALLAIVFAPLRQLLQRGVDRLLYGDRRDPYAAITRLGRHFGEPTQAAAEVAAALALDHVAVELADVGVVASYGSAAGLATPTTVPLVIGGEPVGRLVLGRRGSGPAVGRGNAKLVDDLARQMAVIAYATRLTTDLQRSRTELITALEDERRRLRRDLHDGLGPSLAAVTLKLDAASLLVHEDPDAAAHALVRLKDDVRHTIASIRRLVYGLRPPALDELGLVGALEARALDFAPGLQVDVDAEGPFPELPAAVEVAVYRIAAEALTNVARHAHTDRCALRLRVNGDVQLDVVDHGHGLARGWTSGVGIRSLYERTAELGGTCTVEAVPGGGTHVQARLPVSVDGVR